MKKESLKKKDLKRIEEKMNLLEKENFVLRK